MVASSTNATHVGPQGVAEPGAGDVVVMGVLTASSIALAAEHDMVAERRDTRLPAAMQWLHESTMGRGMASA